MTVRLTPTESDSPPPQQDPAPTGTSEAGAASGGRPAPDDPSPPDGAPDGVSPPDGVSDTGSGGPDDQPAADSRRQVREARHQRRRTAWLCAALVAVCLALTIVVVTLARYRPAGPPASMSGPVVTVAPSAATVVDGAVSSPDPSRGATAPEGGNP